MSYIKFIASAAAVLVALASCNKNEPVGRDFVPQGELYEVCVGIDAPYVTPVSKADNKPTEAESAYKDAYILVFDEQGKLESYKPWSGNSLVFALAPGKKTFVAVLNAGADIVNVASLDAFNAKTSLLSDIQSKGFLMIGKQAASVPEDPDLQITVTRLAAKVAVGKFKAQFESPVLATKTAKLDSVYLINVSSKNTYDGALGGEWANKMRYDSGASSVIAKVGVNQTLVQGQDYDLNYVFYMLPNPTGEDHHNGEWCARKTRIVFVVEIDGELYYYNKTFPSVISNGLYSVNTTTITKIGGQNPDDAMDTNGITANIVISDWTPAGDYDETL